MDNEKSGLKEILKEYQEMQNSIEVKDEKIKDLEKALVNNVEGLTERIDSLTNQLKDKFSNDEFVLVSVADLNLISSSLERAEDGLTCGISDTEDIEYQEIGNIVYSLGDVVTTLCGANDYVVEAQNKIADFMSRTQELDSVGAAEDLIKASESKPTQKKAPAKKISVKVVE